MSRLAAGVGGVGGEALGRAVAAMLDAVPHLHHEAPAIHAGDGAVLGERALLLLPAGRDVRGPVTSEDGRCAIAWDGMLFDPAAVADAIKRAGRPLPADRSDAALALAAYRAFGPRCPVHLDGAFAFAIWDAAERKLFCARDALGVRPLFYTRAGGVHLVASEIVQLLAAPGVARRPNEAMVADYLAGDVDLRSDSFFEGIHRLPGGCWAWLDGQREEIHPYWELDGARRIELASDDAYSERFRELFERSVQRNLEASAPLGSNLSGGLDSSSIVCVATRLRAAAGVQVPLQTFSLAFDDKAVDEGVHVEAVIAKTQIAHNAYRADAEDLFRHIPHVQARQAEPFRSLGVVLFYRLKELAAREHMQVLLNGMGADEVLGGINLFYLSDLLREGRFADLGRTLTRLATLDPFALGLGRLGLLKRFAVQPLVPPALERLRKRLKGSEVPEPMAPAFARRVRALERITTPRPSPFRDRYRSMAYDGLRHTYTPLLMHYEDTNAAGLGMESRFPFLDRELVEYLFAIPREQKLRDSVAKVVLRNGMRGILPESVRTRTDKGFIDRRVDHWLGHQYRDTVERVFGGAALRESGWIDLAALDRLYREYQGGGGGRLTIWKCFNLGVWLETFFA